MSAKSVLLLLVLLSTSCSMRTLYPAMGAGVGAGAGSLAGPGGAIAGGIGGALTGQILKGEDDVEEIVSTVKQISEGDVEGLISSRMKEHRTFVDKVLDGMRDLLLWTGIGCAVLFLVPMIYSRWIHKKTVEKISSGPDPSRRKETAPP